MPSGFGFPVDNDFWMPLRMDLTRWAPGEGPDLRVFGRLGPGVTLASAQQEVRARGAAVRGDLAGGSTPTTSDVAPYPQTILSLGAFTSIKLLSSNVPILLVVLLVVGNVALLVFARAASREKDIVVRTALGASRGRIITELFAETLVLAVPAVLVGIAFIHFALDQTFRTVEAEFPLPYWFAPTLSPGTVAYILVLAVAAALVAALLPGLKLTGIHERKASPGRVSLAARLNQTASNPAVYRFGGIWNVVIVCQIAVAAPLTILVIAGEDERQDMLNYDFGFAAEEFVGGNLMLAFDRTDPGAPANLEDDRALYELRLDQVRERLLEDPRVLGVAYTESLPGTYRPGRRVQVDGLEAANANGALLGTGTTRVSANYFSVLGVQMLAGRDFTGADLSTRDVVIVNEAFVRRILNGGNAIGVRIRLGPIDRGDLPRNELLPWYEIVGVVKNVATQTTNGRRLAVYEPMASSPNPVSVVVHAREERDQVLALLQAAVVEVDPMLRLHDPIRLEDFNSSEQRLNAYLMFVVTSAYSLALLLAIGGLYAVMSFTVTQRTRELGIRRALGGSRTRVLAAVLRRPILQAFTGVSVGAAITIWLLRPDRAWIAIAAIVMLGICFLATVVPARRALMVEPTDALRTDG
jgi:putative ABC transport system permease protein